jgi:hypothetical protein
VEEHRAIQFDDAEQFGKGIHGFANADDVGAWFFGAWVLGASGRTNPEPRTQNDEPPCSSLSHQGWRIGAVKS